MQRVSFCFRCGTFPRAYATKQPSVDELFDEGWRPGPSGLLMICGQCLKWPHIRRWQDTTEHYRVSLSAQPN